MMFSPDWMQWYDVLQKPSWTPAPATIGLIWSFLYPIIATSLGVYLNSDTAQKIALDDRPAIHGQSDRQLGIYTLAIRFTKPRSGTDRHRYRLGDHPLLYGSRLASISLGRMGPIAIPRLGYARDSTADFHLA